MQAKGKSRMTGQGFTWRKAYSGKDCAMAAFLRLLQVACATLIVFTLTTKYILDTRTYFLYNILMIRIEYE